MSMQPTARRGWRTVGVVGAACVACCAGPVLAAIGGLGALGSIAAFLVWPAAGLVLAAVTLAAVVVVRRHRSEPAAEEPVRVELSSWPRPSASASKQP